MNPKRKKRLIIVMALVLGTGAAVGLTTFALSQNINLFYSPAQIEKGEAPKNRLIRVGGMVVDGSVKRDPKSLKVAFDVTDSEGTLTINYEGILPDLFREGQGIVAQGKMDSNGNFVASEVLAKHDENYMPPEVMEALKQAEAAKKAAEETTNKGK